MTEASDLQLAQQSDEALQEDDRPQDDEQQVEDSLETEAASEVAETEPTDEEDVIAAEEALAVSRPAAGETVTIESEAGARYVIAFDATEAQVQIQGNDFLLLFEDGGRIVFADLVSLATSERAPLLQVQGTTIGSGSIVAQAQALAGQQPTLETAAGDQEGDEPIGSGENRYNDDLGTIIDTLQAQPDIPYVERSFRLIDLEVIDPLPLEEEPDEPLVPSISALPASGTVAEQFLPPRSMAGSQFDSSAGPGISEDPNAPDAGFRGFVAFDQSNGGVITELRLADGTPVAPLGPSGGSESVVYDGFTLGPISGEEGDFLFITPLGNLLFVDHESGEFIYILADNEAHPGTNLGGADDVLTETFEFTVTNAFGSSASAEIVMDIQDDLPVARDEALVKVFEGESVVIPGSVLDNDTEGADGIEVIASIGLTGAPGDQVSLAGGPVQIAGQFGTLTINAAGEYSYEANDLPEPHPADPRDQFVYTLVEGDGDSSQATIAIEVKDLPGGDLVVADTAGTSYIPEDTTTPVTLSASLGAAPSPDDILTQVVLDLPFGVDTSGSDSSLWQIDLSQLETLFGVAENGSNPSGLVTSWSFDEASGQLTINLNNDPAVTDPLLSPDRANFEATFDMTPPLDSDQDIEGAVITATALDTAFGVSGTGSSSADITVDAIVDGSEVLLDDSLIEAGNNAVGTTTDTPVHLELTLELGPDSTDQGNGDVSQGDEDGSPAGDASEEVILVTVQVDQGATLNADAAPSSTQDLGGGVTLYSFDTSDLSEAQVNALVESFQVTPATGVTDDIGVTIETTTRERNTPPATTDAASGNEADTDDNTDVDSYQLTVKILDNPEGKLEAGDQTDGYIPEDVPTDVTLTASVGDPSDPDEVLTEIVVDFGLPIDLNGSDPETQWQLDPASLTTILALPEVTAIDLTDGGNVLTVALNGTTQTFSADLLLTPPLDSDADLTDVEVTVTAQDSALGTTASATSSNDVTVDAIVDGTDVITTAAASGLQNQFAAIDLNAEIIFGEDSSNVGNSADPSQADVTDGSTADDVTEFVSSIVVELTDKDSGTPSGSLEFQNPLPSGVTVTENEADHSWTFEIDPSVSRTDVENLVESFSVRPEPNYSGTLTANITATTKELNTPPDSTNAGSGEEVSVADNVDVDSYNIDVEVEPISVQKQVEVSGGEPKPFNLVFVIDRSGSMGESVQGGGSSKFAVAEDAFRTLIQSIRDQGIDVANVRILGFNTGALDVMDLTSLPSDAELDDFFDDLGNPNGGTRYEPPLESAAQFLSAINGGNPDVEYDNRIFFLSDGGNNNSAGGFLLGTSNGNDNTSRYDDLARLYGNAGDVGDDIPNLTIKSVGFGIDKSFEGDGQSNIPGGTPVNTYLALDQSDDNMVNGSAIVSNANNGADLAASFGDVVDPSLITGTLFDGHSFVGSGQLNQVGHLDRLYDASSSVDNADRNTALAGDVVENDGGVVTFKTENGGFMTVWFVDQGGNIEGDFRYEGPPNFPGARTDSLTYVVQDDVGLQLGQLDVIISGQAPANGDFENGNLVDWDTVGSVYVEDNADLSNSNPDGDDFVAVLATNNANGLDPRDGPGNGNREDEGVVDEDTLEDGNLTPVEDLGSDPDLQDLALYTESDLESFLASNGEGSNAVDLSGLVADDLLDGAVMQTSFELDPLFGTPDGNQNLDVTFDWNFLTDEGSGGENDIAFAVVEGQLFLLGSVDGSSFTEGAVDVGENEITYDRSTGWQNTTLSLGTDFTDVDGDNVIHVAFGVMDGGSDVGNNSALVLDNVQADVS